MEHTALKGQLYTMPFYFNDHRKPMKVNVDTGKGTIRGIRKQLRKMMNLELDEVIVCMLNGPSWIGQVLDEDIWDPNMEYAGYQIAARQPSVRRSEKQSLAMVQFRYEVYNAKGREIHSEKFGVPLLISLPSKEEWGTCEVYDQILVQSQHFLINVPNVKYDKKFITKGHGVFHLDLSWYERYGFEAFTHIDATWKIDGIKKHWNGITYDKHVSIGVPPGRAWAPTVKRVMVEVVKEEVKECVVCMNAVADTAFLHKYVGLKRSTHTIVEQVTCIFVGIVPTNCSEPPKSVPLVPHPRNPSIASSLTDGQGEVLETRE